MVRHILMLGPGREVTGGISSVVNVYLNSNLSNKYRIVYISTQVDGSKLWKLIQFIISIVFFFTKCHLVEMKLFTFTVLPDQVFIGRVFLFYFLNCSEKKLFYTFMGQNLRFSTIKKVVF